MVPRCSPLEPWEWSAILERFDGLDPTVVALLPGLLWAQALMRHSELLRRGPWSVADTQQRTAILPCRQKPTTRLEHRLYALFAE